MKRYCIFWIFISLATCALYSQNASDISRRVKSRTFPSVFQAWGDATNLACRDSVISTEFKYGYEIEIFAPCEGDENATVTAARHDLIWHQVEYFGLEWDTAKVNGWQILAEGFTDSSIVKGLNFRQELLRLNPNIILIANLNYRDGEAPWLPDDHEWWKRDADGNKAVGWLGGPVPWYLLDFSNPEFQTHVAKWAKSATSSGVVDGVLLDWWNEGQETNARLALLQEVRNAVGDSALIIVNPNDRQSPGSAPYINGVFMETARNIPKTPVRWNQIQEALIWNQANVLEPKLVCLEVWYDQSRNEFNRMRATTTMSLTLSDGYCLFSEPNSVPGIDHRHDWYPFWDKSLGKAVGEGGLQPNGTYMREFENGYAVYNPMGNGQVEVVFPVSHTSVATGITGVTHRVADQDGDIFISNSRF